MLHALRFKMNDTNESLDEFSGRICAEMREDDYQNEGHERSWKLSEDL
jgi:hypothetical protein